MIRRLSLLACAVAAAAVATPARAQQPLGTALPAAEHAPGTIMHQQQDADAASVAPAAQPAAQRRFAGVQRVDLEQDGDRLIVAVPVPASATWTVSEPFYLGDRVRVHLDIAVRRAPRLVLPPPAGRLLEISAGEDLASTRLTIEVADLGSYDAHLEDGRVLLVLEPAPPAAPAALDVAAVPQTTVPDPAAPRDAATDAASGARAMVAALVVRAGDALRGLGATVRPHADALMRVATDPAHRGIVAPMLGVLLALLMGAAVATLSRRRRPGPRSIVLGSPRSAAAPAAFAGPAAAPAMVAAHAQPVAPAPAPRRAFAAKPRPGAGSHGAALSMAAAGLSHADIAARLRVSRDAVRLLLATSAIRPDDASASGRNFPAGRARRRLPFFGRNR